MNHTALTNPTAAHTIEEVNQWLKPEPPKPENDLSPKPSAIEKLLPLLRGLGSLLVIASAIAFLVQGWSEASHAMRYLSFLGFTVILSAAGFLCATRFADARTARSLLAVSAAIVPVHFCQLGALLFSRFGTPLDAYRYPAWLHWQAASAGEALVLSGVGSVVLCLVTFLAFVTLIRPAARSATLMYIACNAVLLLPVRSPNTVAGLLLALLAATFVTDSRLVSAGPAARTREGIFVRAMLAVPPLLLALRSIHLYDWSFLLTGALLAGIAVALFELAPCATKSAAWQSVFQYTGAVAAVASWSSVAREVWIQLARVDHLNPEIAFPLLVAIPIPVLLAALSTRALQGRRALLSLAGASALVLGLSGQLLFGGAVTVVVALAACIVTFAAAFLSGAYLLVWFSGCTFIFSLWHSLGELILESPWISLGVAGVLTLIGTAALQKHAVGRLQPAARQPGQLRSHGSLMVEE